MGIQPGGTPPPPGNYIFPYGPNTGQGSGSVHTAQQNWTNSTIKSTLKGAPIDSFTNAQNLHNTTVKGRFVDIENEMAGQGGVLGNHENRITKLESGNQVAEYFSNDVWTKPSIPVEGGTEPFHHHDFIGIAGGGGGRRSGASGGAPRGGGYGGGQGGYGSQSVLDGSVASTVNVFIGVGGTGATANGTNGNPGTATYFSDTDGTFFSCGGGPGGSTSAPNTGSGTFPEWAANGGQAGTITGNSTVDPPSAGGNGYLADGGAAGQNVGGSGGNGGACPAGRIGPGGGGGGAYTTDFSSNGGIGGDGGFPGGGGGAGGPNASTGGSTGNGGNGAIGRAVIISYVAA